MTKQDLSERSSSPTPTLCTIQKLFTMRQSIMSIIFAAAVLFECYARGSVYESVALPVGKTDDISWEQDTFTSLPSNEEIEKSLSEDLAAVGKTRGYTVVGNPNLLRALYNGLSLYQKRSDDNNLAIKHRDALQGNIPNLRRDTMKCMVGRVYRPCWKA